MTEPLNPPAQADDRIAPPTPEPVPLDDPAPTPAATASGHAPDSAEPEPTESDASEAEPLTEPEPTPDAAEPEPESPAEPTEPEPASAAAPVEPYPLAEPEPAPDAIESEPESPAEPAEPEPVSETPEPEAEPLTEPEPAPGQAAEVGQVADEDDTLPDLTGDDALACALEALLLVVDAPASEESLALALDQPVIRVAEMLALMSARYTEDDRGIDLRRIGDGWRFVTRDRYAPFVEKLLLDGQRAKLTRAALETLAVIAYRQPVTRARVAAVRGVNVDGVIRTLLARGLIEETGTDAETGGLLYRTTELFLERLGLSSLEDLPPIAPLLPEVDAIDDV